MNWICQSFLDGNRNKSPNFFLNVINPKFYKLAGWGLIVSSFYFTWVLFLVVAVVLYSLATTGELVISTTLTPEESIIKWIKTFYVHVLIGVALIIGGRFVLKRRPT